MSTALIPLAVSAPTALGGFAGERPRAEFLTQLIAMRGKAPQTRLRRRAEPKEAVATYAAQVRTPRPTGRALSRSL